MPEGGTIRDLRVRSRPPASPSHSGHRCYRAGKALRDSQTISPASTSATRPALPHRSCAHGRPLRLGPFHRHGKQTWHDSTPLPGTPKSTAFLPPSNKFDDLLAAPEPLEGSLEGLFQGCCRRAQSCRPDRHAPSPCRLSRQRRELFRARKLSPAVSAPINLLLAANSSDHRILHARNPACGGTRYVVPLQYFREICFVAQSSLHLANAGLRGKLVCRAD